MLNYLDFGILIAYVLMIITVGCGSICRIMPDLFEAGYDIINPVQINCFEMDPVVLKAEFGKGIAFWGGGCDTASILNKATPEEVRKHVLERCKICSKDGGFIFNTIHNILPEVPAQNILAAFNAVKEFNMILMDGESS